MMVSNNPAGRLHSTLVALMARTDGVKTRKAWADAFDLDENDTGHILSSVAALIEQMKLAKSSIESLQLSKALKESLLRPFENIEKAFATTNFEQAIGTIRPFLGADVLLALEFCSHELARHQEEQSIDSEKLEKFLSDINDLEAQVIESTLDPTLKEMILTNLENIRQAILGYRIRGLFGIQAEIDRTVGAVYRNRSAMASAAERDPQTKTIIERMSGLVSNLQVAIRFATTMNKLIDKGHDLFDKITEIIS